MISARTCNQIIPELVGYPQGDIDTYPGTLGAIKWVHIMFYTFAFCAVGNCSVATGSNFANRTDVGIILPESDTEVWISLVRLRTRNSTATTIASPASPLTHQGQPKATTVAVITTLSTASGSSSCQPSRIRRS